MASNLWIDLDKTLIKQDSSMTCLKRLRRDLGVLQLLEIIIRHKFNRFNIKSEVADRVNLTSINWIYDENLLEFLENRFIEGFQINLITASSETIAKFFAETLPFISEVYFSTNTLDMRGSAKYQVMKSKSYGDFEYFGNSLSDIKVWERIGHANISKSNFRVRIALFIMKKNLTIDLF